MRRPLALGATLAALALAALTNLAPVLGQEAPPGHDSYPAPSNTPANPAMGAEDPSRSGTMTKGTENQNNNRLPQQSAGQTNATTNEVTAPEESAASTAYTPASEPPPGARKELPTTASDTPFVGIVGALSLGLALALKARRREAKEA